MPHTLKLKMHDVIFCNLAERDSTIKHFQFKLKYETKLYLNIASQQLQPSKKWHESEHMEILCITFYILYILNGKCEKWMVKNKNICFQQSVSENTK
jgi:hypothetical protein